MHTHPFPEPDSAENERFTVYARVEIVAMLRALCEQRVLLTAYYDRQSGFSVTAVLAVNPEFEEVVLDAPPDRAAAEQLYAAEEIVFVGFLNQIKVQFVARRAQPAVHEGRPAYRVRLPGEFLRLQRRDFFRVRTQVGKPATCLVPHPLPHPLSEGDAVDDAGARTYEKLALCDISIGGLGLLVDPHKFALPSDAVLDDCYLDLPGIGQLSVSLRVRYTEEAARVGTLRRCGCEFVHIAPQGRLMLQRYVNKLDAERMAQRSPSSAMAKVNSR